jgi:aminoglycoside phosphotransferase (APT) family kinase protein
VVRWIDGHHPPSIDPRGPVASSPTALATDLADVVAALRGLDVPAEAAKDPRLRWYRGRPLAESDRATRSAIERCRSIPGLDLDLDAAQSIWEEALRLPGASKVIGPDRWSHGDLVAENLLLTDDRLVAVLDLGSLSVGDPTIDLHGAWEVLDAPARERFRQRLGVDDATWLRGRAWALTIALGTFGYYWETMPGRRADRLAMARNVLASAELAG